MIYHVTPCPFCGHKQMPRPPKTPRPYAECPSCGQHSRAAITKQKDGSVYVRYVSTAGQHGGKSFSITGRLKIEPYRAKLKKCGMTVAEIVKEKLDSI